MEMIFELGLQLSCYLIIIKNVELLTITNFLQNTLIWKYNSLAL